MVTKLNNKNLTVFADFAEERKLLLEFVGPELQIVCNEYQIEVCKR